MHTISLTRRLLRTGVLCGLLALLAACSTGNGSTAATPTAQHTPASSATSALSPSPSPGVGLGPQACPDAVKDPTYWDTLIPTQEGVSQVQSVTCGNLKGVPTLQALVTVLYSGSGAITDVYVYDNITGATPNQIFKLQGLYKGDAKISVYNTIMTAEVDPNSSVNLNQANAALTRDLFREFKWSDGVGTLVQVAFPGFFPDLTRYQAEADQAQVNQGHDSWKLSPTKTAQAFGSSLLKWDPNATATLVSGGGAKDVEAVVNLKNTTPPTDNGITIDLARLEGNTNGGIWIVTDLETTGLAISQPQAGSIIHKASTITGTGDAFEGVIGKITVLDHLFKDIGHATAHGATGNGNTTFTTSITSQPTFTGGAQEGLVLLTALSNANGKVSGAAIVKVLIQQ